MFFGMLYPFGVKPVLRVIGVTAKPQLGTVDAASRKRLLHERARHQYNLVQQHTGQRSALYQRVTAFVLAAEHFKVIRNAVAPYLKHLISSAPAHCIAFFRKRH